MPPSRTRYVVVVWGPNGEVYGLTGTYLTRQRAAREIGEFSKLGYHADGYAIWDGTALRKLLRDRGVSA